MRAYSADLKERLVRAVADGLPMREAARRCDVAVTTVKRAVVQQRTTGSLVRQPIPGRPRVLRGEQEAILRARLEAAADATLLAHGAWWAEHQGQQVRRLARLVDDLVEVARIQSGKLEMCPASCDLAEIVSEVVTEQRAVRPERTIRLDVAVPAGQLIGVEADADRVGQVLTNYLTNALKYSSEESPVEVALRVEGGVARVSVRDHGPGIPTEEQARVWERGYRVPDIEASGEGVSLGLGLHISREIIERHGGQVGVESVVGEGSTFWFSLPLSHTV